jgi:transposase-like protein
MAKRKQRRRYSDSDRAKALAALDANGGDVRKTARALDVPRTTLEGWARGRTPPPPAEVAATEKKALADRFDDAVNQMLDIAPDKLQAASLQQLYTSIGIAVDKAQLLRGQPTAINAHRDVKSLSDAELDARIAELEGRLYGSPRGNGQAEKRPPP